MVRPFVLMSQGKVEEEQGVVVLNTDVLFDRPEVTRPDKVQALRNELAAIDAESPTFPLGQWITICDDWLQDHREANPPSEG